MSLKKNKNLRKLVILIFMCVILFLIYEIVHIYAAFYSELTGRVKFENGVWNIKINDTEISKGIKTTFDVNQINTGENIHVKPGRLAPGLSGNFDILINPENTSVSIRYDISLNQEALTNECLKIKSISEIMAGNELIKTEENTYTGVIPLEKIKNGTKNKINIEIEWVDNEENSKQDTILGTNEMAKIKIPINVHVCQYMGEEINSIE